MTSPNIRLMGRANLQARASGSPPGRTSPPHRPPLLGLGAFGSATSSFHIDVSLRLPEDNSNDLVSGRSSSKTAALATQIGATTTALKSRQGERLTINTGAPSDRHDNQYEIDTSRSDDSTRVQIPGDLMARRRAAAAKSLLAHQASNTGDSHSIDGIPATAAAATVTCASGPKPVFNYAAPIIARTQEAANACSLAASEGPTTSVPSHASQSVLPPDQTSVLGPTSGSKRPLDLVAQNVPRRVRKTLKIDDLAEVAMMMPAKRPSRKVEDGELPSRTTSALPPFVQHGLAHSLETRKPRFPNADDEVTSPASKIAISGPESATADQRAKTGSTRPTELFPAAPTTSPGKTDATGPACMSTNNKIYVTKNAFHRGGIRKKSQPLVFKHIRKVPPNKRKRKPAPSAASSIAAVRDPQLATMAAGTRNYSAEAPTQMGHAANASSNVNESAEWSAKEDDDFPDESGDDDDYVSKSQFSDSRLVAVIQEALSEGIGRIEFDKKRISLDKYRLGNFKGYPCVYEERDGIDKVMVTEENISCMLRAAYSDLVDVAKSAAFTLEEAEDVFIATTHRLFSADMVNFISASGLWEQRSDKMRQALECAIRNRFTMSSSDSDSLEHGSATAASASKFDKSQEWPEKDNSDFPSGADDEGYQYAASKVDESGEWSETEDEYFNAGAGNEGPEDAVSASKFDKFQEWPEQDNSDFPSGADDEDGDKEDYQYAASKVDESGEWSEKEDEYFNAGAGDDGPEDAVSASKFDKFQRWPEKDNSDFPSGADGDKEDYQYAASVSSSVGRNGFAQSYQDGATPCTYTQSGDREEFLLAEEVDHDGVESELLLERARLESNGSVTEKTTDDYPGCGMEDAALVKMLLTAKARKIGLIKYKEKKYYLEKYEPGYYQTHLCLYVKRQNGRYKVVVTPSNIKGLMQAAYDAVVGDAIRSPGWYDEKMVEKRLIREVEVNFNLKAKQYWRISGWWNSRSEAQKFVLQAATSAPMVPNARRAIFPYSTAPSNGYSRASNDPRELGNPRAGPPMAANYYANIDPREFGNPRAGPPMAANYYANLDPRELGNFSAAPPMAANYYANVDNSTTNGNRTTNNYYSSAPPEDIEELKNLVKASGKNTQQCLKNLQKRNDKQFKRVHQAVGNREMVLQNVLEQKERDEFAAIFVKRPFTIHDIRFILYSFWGYQYPKRTTKVPLMDELISKMIEVGITAKSVKPSKASVVDQLLRKGVEIKFSDFTF